MKLPLLYLILKTVCPYIILKFLKEQPVISRNLLTTHMSTLKLDNISLLAPTLPPSLLYWFLVHSIHQTTITRNPHPTSTTKCLLISNRRDIAKTQNQVGIAKNYIGLLFPKYPEMWTSLLVWGFLRQSIIMWSIFALFCSTTPPQLSIQISTHLSQSSNLL